MIERNTVFILGAGASMPYGFPSGEKLLEMIKKNLRSQESKEFVQLRGVGFSADHIKEFYKNLHYSGKQTIDSFLQHQGEEYLEIGKATIAQVLMLFENEGSIFGEEPISGDWYKYIYSLCSDDKFDNFNQNKVSFITYNYDRSLEYFLFTALKHTYNKKESEVREKLSSIPIVHLHGKMGNLPWEGENSREYTSEYTNPAIKFFSKGINIIHENLSENQEFIQARQLLGKADNICFLGHGYDKLNIKRLRLSQSRKKNCVVLGTAYGKNDREKEEISNLVGFPVILGDSKEDSLAFLKKKYDPRAI